MIAIDKVLKLAASTLRPPTASPDVGTRHPRWGEHLAGSRFGGGAGSLARETRGAALIAGLKRVSSMYEGCQESLCTQIVFRIVIITKKITVR